MEQNKKIKVLMVVSSLDISSGVNSFAMNYLRRLDHRYIQVDFVCFKDSKSPYLNEIESYGGNIFILPKVKKLQKYCKECDRIIKVGEYDIIHNNSLILTIPLMISAKKNNVKVRILHSHSTMLGENKVHSIRNKIFMPILKHEATDFAACSEAAGKAMFGHADFTVIPNVISAEQYVFSDKKRETIRSEMGVCDKKIIGTVGRATYAKNPFFAFDVFKELLKKRTDVEYWWIGDGPLINEMKKYIEEIGIGEQVKLFGKREDVMDLFQAMDCFFAPSLFEGLLLAGVEAQAMGLPSVVSDAVPLEMSYTDLVTYVSLEELPEIWAEKINRELDCKIDRHKYLDALKNSTFSDIESGNFLTKIYQQLLKKCTGK